jgi:hypothetical protein
LPRIDFALTGKIGKQTSKFSGMRSENDRAVGGYDTHIVKTPAQRREPVGIDDALPGPLDQ